MKKIISMNELSSLIANPDPTKWLSLLKELQKSEKFMAKTYEPLRDAICAELAKPGSGETILNHGLAFVPPKTRKTISEKSIQAFANFKKWYPKHIKTYDEKLIGSRSPRTAVTYHGYELKGNFHIRGTDVKGTPVLMYFTCSDWTKDPKQIQSNLEILTIIAEKRYGFKREQIWLIDLLTGTVNRPPKSYKRLRNKFDKYLELLSHIQKSA